MDMMTAATTTTGATGGASRRPADEAIAADARALSEQLKAMRDRLFAPTAMKTLRSFTSGEAAKLIGVSDGYLRQLSLAGEGPQPDTGPADDAPIRSPISTRCAGIWPNRRSPKAMAPRRAVISNGAMPREASICR